MLWDLFHKIDDSQINLSERATYHPQGNRIPKYRCKILMFQSKFTYFHISADMNSVEIFWK